MGLAISSQLRQLVLFAALGAALGLWYDLLSPLRRGRLLTAAADLLFALSALAGLFGMGQFSAEGALYLYMAACAAAGFALWLHLASPIVRRGLRALGARIAGSSLAAAAEKARTRLKEYGKFLFSSAAKWFTMSLEQAREKRRERGRRQTAYEAAQGKSADDAGHSGAARIRVRKPASDAGKAGRRRKNRR